MSEWYKDKGTHFRVIDGEYWGSVQKIGIFPDGNSYYCGTLHSNSRIPIIQHENIKCKTAKEAKIRVEKLYEKQIGVKEV